jgi:hypothetical protein
MVHGPGPSDLLRDLEALSPADRIRVCRWAEDRFVNAIAALKVRLSLECPGVLAADKTLQCAQRSVTLVMTGVDEIRTLAGGR